MPFCNQCGAALEANANFCTKCGRPAASAALAGMKSPDFVAAWSVLYDQLDTVRNKWFELTKEIIMDEIRPRGGSIVNEVMNESRRVDMREGETPASYPYNTVNGPIVESFIIGWQIQVAISFCTGELVVLGKRMNYVHSGQVDKFLEAFVKTVEGKPRWVDAMVTQVTGSSIAEEDVVTVLAHYLMGDPTDSEMVRIARQAMRPNSMGFLKALCCACAAAAFGDGATMHAIQAAMTSH